MAIRTTFITGHPGETQEDHEDLMAFIDECQFDAVGVFKYSPEDGTPSGTMDKDPALHVPDDVKEAREQELMLLQQEIAFENAAYLAEQKVQFDVLIEGPVKGRTTGRATTGVTKGGSLFTGRTYFQAPQIDSLSYIHSREPLVAGELVRCTVVASDGYDLVMQPTEDLERSVKLPVLGR
jgi:ribosomal protein S12 methylthiotransferase